MITTVTVRSLWLLSRVALCHPPGKHRIRLTPKPTTHFRVSTEPTRFQLQIPHRPPSVQQQQGETSPVKFQSLAALHQHPRRPPRRRPPLATAHSTTLRRSLLRAASPSPALQFNSFWRTAGPPAPQQHLPTGHRFKLQRLPRPFRVVSPAQGLHCSVPSSLLPPVSPTPTLHLPNFSGYKPPAPLQHLPTGHRFKLQGLSQPTRAVSPTFSSSSWRPTGGWSLSTTLRHKN